MSALRSVVRRLLARLPQGEYARGVFTLVGGTTLAQGMAVVSAPVLTRLYSPSEFGAYAVAVSILAILITVSSLSYPMAIPLPDRETSAADVLALSLAIALAMAAAAGVVLWLFGSEILALMGASAVAPYVLLLPIGQIGGAFVVAMTNWAVRIKRFSAIAATQLTQTGTLVVAQVLLGAGGLGVVGLLAGDVAGRFSGSTRLAREAWRASADALRQASLGGMRTAAVRYRRFAIFSTPSAIVNTVGLQVPLLLLVALYGAEVGGQYALANRLTALPVTLIAKAVGQVYFAEGARVARERPEALRSLFLRTTTSLARVAIGPFLLMALAAPILAAPVFGTRWADAGLFVAILTPMYLLALIANPTNSTLAFLERQELQIVLGALRLVLLSTAVAAASLLNLPPIGAVCMLSLGGSLTYLSFALGSWRAISRHTSVARALPDRAASPIVTPPPDTTSAGPV